MPKLIQGVDRFKTNARVAKASPFEAVETIEGRPRNVSCDITSEGRTYLASRGIKKSEAEGLLVNGFIDPVTKEIPLEYSIELNRLINLEMAGSVG